MVEELTARLAMARRVRNKYILLSVEALCKEFDDQAIAQALPGTKRYQKLILSKIQSGELKWEDVF
jgi:hypothetical protein